MPRIPRPSSAFDRAAAVADLEQRAVDDLARQLDGGWRIDPDTPEDEREVAHQTAQCVARYLRTHPPRGRASSKFVVGPGHAQAGPEFLLVDPTRTLWLVRWPNGQLKWESAVSLAARGHVPTQPIIAGGQFLDPRLATEVAEAFNDMARHQGRG